MSEVGKPARNFAPRTIWTGDNLDILRGLNSETVDLIYLDPPFNSNRTYSAPIGSKAAGAAFEDTWTLDKEDVAWMGLIADQHPAIHSVIAAAGAAHGTGMQSYLRMMAVRLLEMRRVLAPAGSIYLHCDDTAAAYLRMLMDAVFGRSTFRANIVWRRQSANSSGRGFGRIVDHLLYYARPGFAWNQPYMSMSAAQRSRYRMVDSDGRLYRSQDLTAKYSEAGGRRFNWRGAVPRAGNGWRYTRADIETLYAEGRIILRKDGVPRLDGHKKYLDEHPGSIVQNLWTDISRVGNTAKERTGYPTQKPLALLHRIIEASSNPGDVVLDPFCGCATACVAADNLQREWVGIDISPMAVELVHRRLRDTLGGLYHAGMVTARSDIPQRTDIEAPINYRQNRHVLFGEQEGKCNGCKMEFPFKMFEVDHQVPRSRGGTDHKSNLQLLCSPCNRIKGDRPMEFLMARLAEYARPA